MYIIIILPQSLSFPLPVTCETSIVQSSPGQSPESPGASAMGNSTAGQNAVIENYSASDFYFLYFFKKNLKLIGKKQTEIQIGVPLVTRWFRDQT